MENAVIFENVYPLMLDNKREELRLIFSSITIAKIQGTAENNTKTKPFSETVATVERERERESILFREQRK